MAKHVTQLTITTASGEHHVRLLPRMVRQLASPLNSVADKYDLQSAPALEAPGETHTSPEAGAFTVLRVDGIATKRIQWKGGREVTSASANIYLKGHHEPLRGFTGARVYVPVVDARQIPELGARLSDRFILAGHGRADISPNRLPRALPTNAFDLVNLAVRDVRDHEPGQ
jgi:hypothetical protein